MKYCRVLLCILLFVLAFVKVPLAAAFEVRSGNSTNISHDQTVNGSMLIAGDTVVVDGVVRGDVYCAGQKITISGLVDGDVLCAGQSIVVSGVVTGNARIAGQNIDISGTVRRNASIVGQTMTLPKEGSINGEMLLAGQTFILDGLIGKSANIAGQTVQVNGRVDGDVWTANQSVSVGDHAVIGGNFKYTSQYQIQIPKTASVSGTVQFTQMKEHKKNPSFTSTLGSMRKASSVGLIAGIIWNIIIVILLVMIFPRKVKAVIEKMHDRPVMTGGVGFLTLIVLPIIGVMLFCTIIGIPFAVLWFLLFALIVGISRSFAALIVGDYIIDSFFTKLKNRKFMPVLFGVPVLWLIFHTPFIGGIISFLAVCWGMGGMARVTKSHKK
jgi:cytoskeletal protein CcmA (bactofilin family)